MNFVATNSVLLGAVSVAIPDQTKTIRF